MKRRNFLKGILVIGMVLVLIMIGNSVSLAQKDYPNREIEIVIGFAAGGMVDLSVRVIHEEFAKNLGVPVVIVNKPGAGGTIGAHYVSQAKPDGYTLMAGPHSLYTIEPALQPNLPYKTSDFVPIARIVYFPFVLAVRKEAPWKTFEEFISYAKKNPGKLTYGSAGVGTGSHLLVELLKIKADLDIQHVPFKSGAHQTTAIMGGHVDFVFMGIPSMAPLLKSGELRSLVATEKVPGFPEVPTATEKGYPDATFSSWTGIVGPKGIEKLVVDKVVNALEKAVKVPRLAKKLEEIGCPVEFVAKEEFGREIEKDSARMAELVKKAKLIVK